MGIYDRDYVRHESSGFFGTFADRGKVCKWLIGINVAVFLLQLVTTSRGFRSSPVTDLLELNVDLVLRGEVWRLITHAFVHSTETPFHILFNMLFLWWFGKDIEGIYGSREFLAFYLGAVLLGGLAFVGFHLQGGLAVGASAGVTAVLVLAAMHFPNRIILLFFVLPVPVWLFVVIFVGMDAFVLLSGSPTQVGVSAHLAGALFGFLYFKLQWRLTGWMRGWSLKKLTRSRPPLRIYREEEPAGVPASVVSARTEEEQLEAKLDAVLARLAEVGRENLTESEREVLVRASELFKRRRT